jgi:hypothetical protein
MFVPAGGRPTNPQALNLSLTCPLRAMREQGQALEHSPRESTRRADANGIDCLAIRVFICGEPRPPKGAPPFLDSVVCDSRSRSVAARRSQSRSAGSVVGQAASVPSIAPHALFMVPAAARRQGPHRLRGLRRPQQGAFPLDRALGRPLRLRASCGANASERSNLSARNRTYRMPTCHDCGHGGADHNWQRRTHWGHCADPGCFCRHYVPKTDRPKPVNAVIGRLLRKKRG